MNRIVFQVTLNTGVTKLIRISGKDDIVTLESGNDFLEALAETGMLRIKAEDDDDGSILEVADVNGKFQKVDGLMLQGADIAMIELRKV